MFLQIQVIALGGIFVFALVLQSLPSVQEDGGVLQVIFAPERTLVAVGGTRVVNQPVALALFVGYIAFQFAVFLGGQTAVARLVQVRCRVIFADSKFLVRTLDPLLDAATAQSKEQRAKNKN
jgi:hypothetical protein